MRKNFLILPVAGILLIACADKKDHAAEGATKAYRDHKAWRASLKDSVDSLKVLYDLNIEQTDVLHSEFEQSVSLFDVISDPVLVEKYRVLKGWKGYDSTAGTGVLARLLEDNTIELIVSCAGERFTSITLESESQKVASETVPEGNALNTTIGSVCRVAFNNAAPLAEFVYDHKDENVLLRFSNGKSIVLTSGQKNMIAATWHLLSTQKRLNELEAQQIVLYNKINIFESEVAKDSLAAESVNDIPEE